MQSRFPASLVAGAAAIAINTAFLKFADAISLPTAHGGLLRMISPWISSPLSILIKHIPGWLQPHASSLPMGFHVVVGLVMATFYAFAIDPFFTARTIIKALAYAGGVWLVNAMLVLPYIGEGFAGCKHLSLLGILWFAVAHTMFFVSLALIYEILRRPMSA